MLNKRIEIYDTTLRDGTQGESVNFSAEDKCRVAEQLDALGVDFIEGGWPGSNRRVFISDLSGRANILAKARELGLELHDEQRVLEELKRLEHDGYEFEAAEASFELLVRKLCGARPSYFELLGFRVIDEHRGALMPVSEATIKVRVGKREEHTAASGNGPVNALDNALRRALEGFYPSLTEMRLVDYKVRVITSSLSGTASFVRVLIFSGDGRGQWGTVGVSANIVEASWRAVGFRRVQVDTRRSAAHH